MWDFGGPTAGLFLHSYIAGCRMSLAACKAGLVSKEGHGCFETVGRDGGVSGSIPTCLMCSGRS